MARPGQGKRILIVDDEDHIREVAKVSLELVGGFEIVATGSAREGLRLAGSARPDAILLDVMMPEMDGPSVVEALRADPATATIPIVLLTAKVQASERRRFDTLPISGVLAKPFDPMALPGQVAAVLGWGHAPG